MKLDERDVQILQHIVKYCNEVQATIDFFGKDIQKFTDNFIYRNAVSMPIQQIGELVGHFSESFTKSYSRIPWAAIRGMRNHFAHGYHVMNIEEIWKTAIRDLPTLNIFCKELLIKYHI